MAQTQVKESAQAGTKLAEKSTETVERVPLSGYWFAALGSMVLSAGLFIIGKRQTSQFVGLWVPSIISLALFYKLLHPSDEVSKARRAAENGNF